MVSTGTYPATAPLPPPHSYTLDVVEHSRENWVTAWGFSNLLGVHWQDFNLMNVKMVEVEMESSNLSHWSGSLDRPSALPWHLVGLYLIWYLWPESIKAQRWSQAAANKGIPVLGPRMVVSGLWSVSNWNSLPNKYGWNFLTPNSIARAYLSSCA